MPDMHLWVNPEPAMTYKGLTVWHTYADNKWDEMREYWFSLSNDAETDQFDIRELPCYDKDLPIETNLMRAIDQGYLFDPDQEIVAKVSGGLITAVRDGDENYPGITIRINGTVAAIIEFANDERQEFRIHSYTETAIEPLHSYSWNGNGKDNGDTIES